MPDDSPKRARKLSAKVLANKKNADDAIAAAKAREDQKEARKKKKLEKREAVEDGVNVKEIMSGEARQRYFHRVLNGNRHS